MNRMFARPLIALAAGLLFGAGLVLSGMADPAKVQGFLDVTGNWDPALAFVMAGAVGTTFIGFRLLRRSPGPLAGDFFEFPAARRIDGRLVLGSILFGIGWGLAGLCPGPAITDLSSGSGPVALFVAAMTAGMALFSLIQVKEVKPERE